MTLATFLCENGFTTAAKQVVTSTLTLLKGTNIIGKNIYRVHMELRSVESKTFQNKISITITS